MGKGNRVRTQNADERKAKKEAAIKKAAKEKLYRRITAAVSIVLAIALAFTFIWAAFLGDIVGRQSMKNAITMKTENYTVSAAEFTYLYMNTYLNYQSYASYFGFSTDTPLESQEYTSSGIEGYTWHDYFVDMTKESVRELLVLCEAAKERGITLDEDEKQFIEDSITELKTTADEQDMSFKKFMKTYFGAHITEDDVRSCMEMQTLAGKAAEEIEAEPTYTDEDLDKECADNMGSYYFSDYLSIEIKADYTTGASDDVISAAKEEAKATAEAILKASTDEETFKKAINEYYREVYNVVPDETEEETTEETTSETTEETTSETTEETTEETDTREQLTETELTEKIDGALTEGSAYTVDTDLGKWLYEQDADGNYIRKANDTKLIEDATNGKYTVYLVVTPMYRNDYATRDVRHILITVDSYDAESGLPDEEAKAKAEELLAEWKAGDATEDSFGELAKENSMDTDPSNGGLYEAVGKGDMVEEFETWLFDAKEKGETGIVKTDYGYHIMYYVGESDTIKWKADAEANLRSADYTEAYEALTEKYTITLDDNAFKKVKQAGT